MPKRPSFHSGRPSFFGCKVSEKWWKTQSWFLIKWRWMPSPLSWQHQNNPTDFWEMFERFRWVHIFFLLRTSFLIRGPASSSGPSIITPSHISTGAVSVRISCHVTERRTRLDENINALPTPTQLLVVLQNERADRQSNLRLIMLLLSIDCAACCSPVKCV